jgi:hypothetical protein
VGLDVDANVSHPDAVARKDFECPNVSRCELYPRLKSEVQMRRLLDRYCYGDFRSCARYCHAKATGTRPPIELMPSGETQT